LEDGRCLVVEYKGTYLWSNDDSKEKRNLGELWAERSNGRCLFIMPKGKDFEAVTAVLRKPKTSKSY
jgi:type III restriction enzyme